MYRADCQYLVFQHHGCRPGPYDDQEWLKKVKSWRQGVKRKWQTLLDTPLSREVIDRCGYLVDRANIKSEMWKEEVGPGSAPGDGVVG